MKTTAGILLFVIAVVISGCFQQQDRGKRTFEIKVTDFAALPDDGKNDTPAILSAIEACRDKQNAKLVFAPGRYDINGGPMGQRGRLQPSLDVKNINNLTIEGNGAELIGHDYSTMFHFTECNNITINNLTVDWDPVPYTHGKVVEAQQEYVDIEVVAPFTAQAGLRTGSLSGYDPETGLMARRYTYHYQMRYDKTSELIRPGVMRLFRSMKGRHPDKLPPVGKHIIVRHQVYGCQAFQFSKCNKVRIGNVNIYSNPGMGITGTVCRDISLRHIKIMIRPGSGRWMSTNADATHFTGCRGTIVMENCLFEAMGDDATNVNAGHYMVVADRLDDGRLRISGGRRGGFSPRPEIGDHLELSDKELVPYAAVTVKSVKYDEKAKTFIAELSDKLPPRTKKGDIVGNASACPSVRIRNCTISRNLGRGFIIKTRDAVIENCTLRDVSSGGIVMNTDITGWWESIGSRDVIIRNNRFINCRFEPAYICGVIESLTSGKKPGVHQRITIENNIIEGSSGNAIKIGSADGVVIVNNIINQPEDEAIFVHNSRNVRVTGNKLTNSDAGLGIGDGCEGPTIKVENNIGF